MGTRMVVCVLALTGATLGGCRMFFDDVTDVSGEPAAWGGWDRNASYETIRPLILVKLPGGRRWRIVADTSYQPPDDPDRPYRFISADQLAQQPDCCPGLDLLPSGTVFRAEAVRWRKSLESSWLDINGRIVEGPFAGRPVELSSVSLGGYTSEKYKWGYRTPNSQFIRRR